MDLLSLDGGERYSALAALIDLGVPDFDEITISGFVFADRRDRLSRLIHEVTHAGSLRTTRLGFLTARIGAKALAGRKEIPKHPALPQAAEIVLGVFSPLLEGLALYGQLDYQAGNDDGMLPFPINKIAANISSDSMMSTAGVSDAIANARVAGIWSSGTGPHAAGLLAALLLDDNPETEHYFAGYVYLKAIAARFARTDPAFSDSATVLPVLVRLICDHPILERACFEEMTAGEIIRPVLHYLEELPDSAVGRIGRMLGKAEFRTGFDNWDIHTQLAGCDDDNPILHGPENVIFEGMSSNQMFAALRAATDVHLTSWVAGRVQKDGWHGPDPTVDLRSGGREISVRIMRHSAWRAFSRSLDERSRRKLQESEDMLYEGLARATRNKAEITLASYITLERGSSGIALWVRRQLVAVIHLSLLNNRLDATETRVALDGLKISPSFRHEFAGALRSTDPVRRSSRQADARGEASHLMMTTLVGNPAWQTIALRCRLPGVLPGRLQAELQEWCDRVLGPGWSVSLPREVEATLSSRFDRPRMGGGSFRELIPDLQSLEDHLRLTMARQAAGEIGNLIGTGVKHV